MSLQDLLYSIHSFKSMEWHLKEVNIKTCYIVNLLHSRKPCFKDFSVSMKIVTEMIELYFLKFNIIHCAKNEVFHWGFLQLTADLVKFTKENLNGKLHFLLSILYSVSLHMLLYLFSFIYFLFSHHLFPVFFC